jgi:hypothetical protein
MWRGLGYGLLAMDCALLFALVALRVRDARRAAAKRREAAQMDDRFWSIVVHDLHDLEDLGR